MMNMSYGRCSLTFTRAALPATRVKFMHRSVLDSEGAIGDAFRMLWACRPPDATHKAT